MLFIRRINNKFYVSPKLSKSHITSPENCLYWVLYMRSRAMNIKTVSWKNWCIMCVSELIALCGQPWRWVQASISEALTRTPTTVYILTTFVLYLFVYLLLIIWVSENSLCCSEQGKYGETFLALLEVLYYSKCRPRDKCFWNCEYCFSCVNPCIPLNCEIIPFIA